MARSTTLGQGAAVRDEIAVLADPQYRRRQLAQLLLDSAFLDEDPGLADHDHGRRIGASDHRSKFAAQRLPRVSLGSEHPAIAG